jgi:hypothetical protein
MLLNLIIPDARAFQAAEHFFSSDGDSVHFAHYTDYSNQSFEFECDDWRDVDATETAITKEWLQHCTANDLDEDFTFERSE